MSAIDAARVVRILLVEDSPADVRLTREVLDEAEFPYELFVAADGEVAMSMLNDSAGFSGSRHPDLVLLDLNLPRKSGREVLAEIKADPRLRRIPVLILSTSTAEADVTACYDAHANCYLTKPVDFGDFVALAASLRDFWLRYAVLPPRIALNSTP